MIDLPESTRIHRRIPKEKFYQRLVLTAALKKKFVSDIDSIFIENSLTAENLRLSKESIITEILLLKIMLKTKEFDGKVLETVARQNSHKLLFMLIYKDELQIALFHNKLYSSSWIKAECCAALTARGFSLDEIWNGFIEQIALYDERDGSLTGLSIDQRLARHEQIAKLEKQIYKAEIAARNEKQPKKSFDLYLKCQKYKQELEDLKHGQ
ncbi:MAG: DUF4391 domain-containing protein [Synergistaceae bacterium]|nr:DUF4391 domain-containing protein [Synergistaceae bacterium]